MKPPAFEYRDPRTQEEAVATLGEHGEAAKILAGGQSLVPMLNLRLLRPAYLVDINRAAGLSFIEVKGGELAIGACTRQRAIERSELVRETCPLLHEAMPFIAHFQIRSRGTIGGSLSHADPAAELPTIVTALGGKLVLRSVRGERIVGAADFYTGFLSTALKPDELLTEIRLPIVPARTGSAFMEVSRRHGDFALAAVAALVRLDQDGRCAFVRLVVAGVHGVPFRSAVTEASLIGTKLLPEDAEDASRLMAAELEPISDLHASADYRRQAARVLARRALGRAALLARPHAEAGT